MSTQPARKPQTAKQPVRKPQTAQQPVRKPQVRKPTDFDHLALQLTRGVLSQRFSKTTTQSCYLCHKNGTKKKPLKSCASCKSALYCSSECQRTHWPTHKEYCKESFYEARLEFTDLMLAIGQALNLPTLPIPKPPPGLTWVELENRFKKWLIFHARTLIAGSMHALQIPDDRSTTHVLFVQTKYRDNVPEVEKCFSLVRAQVKTLKEVSTWGGNLVEELEAVRVDQENTSGKPIIGVLIECLPMKLQVVPVASLHKRSIAYLPWLSNWEDILRDRFENGKDL